MLESLKNRWPEYLIEAWCLGTFMVSASVFGVLLFHPSSPTAFISFNTRNILMGLAMGLTAIGIICSPWGKRSGAHFNPAVTLAFLRLGKIAWADACFYVAAHFAGGILGMLLSRIVLGDLLAAQAVNFVVTVPGRLGATGAFAAEVAISFLMMTVILNSGNSARWSRLTPYLAGALLTLFISLTSTISGTSLNPARTFASAVVGGVWSGWWIYFAAPVIAMLAAAEIFVATRGLKAVLCARFRHNGKARCIFRCAYCAKGIVEATKQPQIFRAISGLL
ncbi:MAG TPA: aquaporin [Pyrinomonadaceae bacterium]|nr:aquaporin [Pyrinomonadaceae bacterium]